jgi:hypothetical protein
MLSYFPMNLVNVVDATFNALILIVSFDFTLVEISPNYSRTDVIITLQQLFLRVFYVNIYYRNSQC